MKITNEPLEQPNENCYRQKNALDKTYKPLFIKWLCDKFQIENYPHSFKDQWISTHIWEGTLSISFDKRQEEHLDLMKSIPEKFFGIAQYGTLKIVNKNTFYLNVDQMTHVKYPKIKSHKLLGKIRSKDSDGDIMSVYHWEIYLDDNTSIYYTNQIPEMDFDYKGYIYNCYIQTRTVEKFLSENYK